MRLSLITTTLAGGVLAAALAPAAPAGAATCTYDELLHAITIQVQTTDAAVGIVRMGNQLAMLRNSDRPTPCPGPRAQAGGATVTNTERVEFSGTTTGEGFILDLSGGPLAPGRTAEPSTEKSELEVFVNGRGGGDSFQIFGSSRNDSIRVGKDGQTMLDADADVDVNLRFPPDTPMLLSYAGRGGDDFISGRGGAPLSTMAASNLALFLDGGDGNDTLLGANSVGNRAGLKDRVSGGAGDDTIDVNDGLGGDSVDGGLGTDKGVSEGVGAESIRQELPDTFSFTETVAFPTSSLAVGRLELRRPVQTVRAGRAAGLALKWTTPGPWRNLKAITVGLYDGGQKVGSAVVHPSTGRVSGGFVTSGRVRHGGRTVNATWSMRLPRRLAGRDLRVAVDAVGRGSHRQSEPAAGLLHVR